MYIPLLEKMSPFPYNRHISGFPSGDHKKKKKKKKTDYNVCV